MKKTTTNTKPVSSSLPTVDINRVYRSIGDKPGVKRLFALALRKLDSGVPLVTFSAAELINARFYKNEQCARVGFDRTMLDLSKVRAGRTPIFSAMQKSGNTYHLTPNASLNLPSAVRGFRVLPDAVLAATAARPRAKLRDLAVAVFCEAQQAVPSIACTGSFEIPFRTLQLRMNLPLLPATATAVGKITLRDPLERAIDRLDSLGAPGLSVTPHYTDGTIGEYLDGSSLTVTFSGKLLVDFLLAFGLTPTAKEKYELTNDSVFFGNHHLYRIRAIENFGNVKAGDLGGWVESENNLSHYGDCWLYDDAVCCDNAVVTGHATVHGHATIARHAVVCGRAQITHEAVVTDNAVVCDNASIAKCAAVCDNALVCDCATVGDNARVGKDSVVNDYCVVCD